jgi:D-amino-acid dehydrogenase
VKRAVIVGGGLIGVATLYELASRGVEAVLLESGPELASGASFANGGMLTPSMPDPWNAPGVWRHLLASLADPYSAMKLRVSAIPGLMHWGFQFLAHSAPRRHAAAMRDNHRLATYSAAATLDLCRTLDLRFDLGDSGTLKVFSSARAFDDALGMCAALEPQGLAFERLTVAGVIEREPQLADAAHQFIGGIHFPADRCGDARQFTLCLAGRATTAGASVRLGTAAAKLIREGGRVIGVRTQSGEDFIGEVVLAAGVAAPDLARDLGFDLPIAPAKGYSVTFPADALGNALPRCAVIDDAMHAAVAPIGRRLRVVGTAEFAGRDARVTPERLEPLYALLDRLYPRLSAQLDRRAALAWAGLRPMSADGRPMIGRSPAPGLWLNCGHGHLGWTMAVGSARLLAQTMVGSAPDIDIARFSWPRR